MSELRSVLEGIQGQVRARPGSLERVFELHRRRRTRRRVAAGALTVAAAAIVVVVVAVVVPIQHRFTGPGSSKIDPANADRLASAWTQHLDGAGSSAPTVAEGVVYVAADSGKLYAVDAGIGALRWVGVTDIGTTTRPVVAGGKVFVHAAGRLYVFDAACASAGATCEPAWSASTGSGGNQASPTIANGVVYVVAEPGGLRAFPVSCERPTACEPLWVRQDTQVHVATSPAVSGDVVWDSSAHALSAFAVDCGTGAASCDPLIANVQPDGADLASGPATADGVLYVGASDGSVFAVATSCASGGSCEPIWRGKTGGSIIATPTIAGDRVYVGSNDGGLYAFPRTCTATAGPCAAAWVGQTAGAIREQPVVANGMVFVTSTDGNLYGFPESCAAGSGNCRPAVVKKVGDLPPAPSVWADRVVYAISADGTLSAYTVDGESVR